MIIKYVTPGQNVPTIGQWADYYHESDFLPPPPGWIEVRSQMPGVTRAFVPPHILTKKKK